MEQIKIWFFGLEENEQKITIAFACGILLLMIYLLLIEPINESSVKLQAKVASLQKDVDWMKGNVSTVLANKGAGRSNAGSSPLSTIVNNSTKKYDLPVSRRDSKSPNEMQVWFDNVSFDVFLTWTAELNSRHGVTVTSVNVRSRDNDGITSINVKLLK